MGTNELSEDIEALPPKHVFKLPKIPKPCPICPVGELAAEEEVQTDENGCPKCAKPKFKACKPGCFRGEVDLETGALPPCFCPPKLKRRCLRCPMCPVGQVAAEEEVQLDESGCPKCRPCRPIRCPLIACARPICPVGEELIEQDEQEEMAVDAGCPRQRCPRRICKPIKRAPCKCKIHKCPVCDEYADEYEEEEVQAIPCLCPSAKCRACKLPKRLPFLTRVPRALLHGQ